MKGYLNNTKATAETIRPGKWLYSGDIAYYDETSRFYIVDRLKELIKVKGFQVAPAELEDLIRSHSDVSDVAVIGVPDEIKGEVPFAFVVAKTGLKEENLAKDLHIFVNEHVSEYKRLVGGIILVGSIPKSASGKILRKDLKALYTKMNGK